MYPKFQAQPLNKTTVSQRLSSLQSASATKVVLTITLVLCVSMSAFSFFRSQVPVASAPIEPTVSAKPESGLQSRMPNLAGAAAQKYLRETNDGQSLMDAITASNPQKTDVFRPLSTATPWYEEINLTAGNGFAFDGGGASVAINGPIAVVGTVQNKAVIFVKVGGIGGRWEQQQTLTVGAPGPANGQGQPVTVAIDGQTIVVSDCLAGGSTERVGNVYIFVRGNAGWTEEKMFAPPVPTRNRYGVSGTAVAISGDTLLLGTQGYNDNHGAIFFAQRSGTSWSQLQRVLANERSTTPASFGQAFGAVVAIEGDTAVVTAPDANVVGTDDKREGAAYVYTRTGTTWTEQAYLTAVEPELSTTGHMGYPGLGLSGNTFVVGANNRAFVFVRNGTTWTQQAVLRGSDAFGFSVDISGDTIVAGAPLQNNNLGAVYVYKRTGTTWIENDQLIPATGEPSPFGEGFLCGFSVAVSGETILSGAPNEKVGSNSHQGAAHLFQLLDSDKDGLPDRWEKEGVTIDGEFINLPKMGADPKHKDLFVHADWMETDPSRPKAVYRPKPSALKIVSDAFLIAPVTNPDLKPGIRLHVDAGSNSVMNPVTRAKWGALSRAGELAFQPVVGFDNPDGEYNWSAVDTLKETYFKRAKRSAVFHYALFCNIYGQSTNDSSGISRGIPGADFLVTLGHPNWTTRNGDVGGTVDQQAGTFMHEFGHNLNLKHGGFEDANFKPNYLSIMSYTFQFIGLLKPNGQRSFDYSRRVLDPLNESGLNENVGINDPDGHLTLWKCPSPGFTSGQRYYKQFFPSRALDWNLNAVKDAAPVAVDINCEGPTGTLTGFKDWPALVFDGAGKIGNAAGASEPDQMSTPHDELSRAEALAAVPQDLLDEELVAPLDVVTVSPQEGGAPLSVSFDGSASTAVTGTIVDWSWDFGDGTTGSGATASHTYTTPGEYYASLTVTDSLGRLNLVPLLNLVTVTDPAFVPKPNLTPFQPSGWSDKVVVSKMTGTNIDDSPLTTNDTLYIDWAVINNGDGPTAVSFYTKLYVDGVEAQTSVTNPPLDIYNGITLQDYSIGQLSAGQHTLKVVADANGAIVETDESDNEYSRVINITGATPTPSPTPTGQPNLTPYQPPGWSDKIVVSTVTGTNADSATLNTTDTLFVDWAAINNGSAPTTGSFETKLYVDGVEKNTRVTSQTINPGGSFGVQDLTIGSLSAGQHAVRIVLDSGGVITESNETDNEYVKTISVLSPLPTPSPTPTPTPVSQTYTVRNTNDTGPDSFRQALLDANSHPNGAGSIDQIVFNIPGPGVHTIMPSASFPAISDAVLIDGYTQPGASPNTLAVGDNAVMLIELNGTNVTFEGLDLTGGNSTIRGLVINHFDSNPLGNIAIRLASSNNVVAGNFIGTNASGTGAVRNVVCVSIASGASNLIGGTTPADRNIVGGGATQAEPGAGTGVQILTTQLGTRIQGNYIGTNAAGNAALGHFRGIDLVGKPSADITIGGLTDTPGTGAGNVISGNSSNGGISNDGIHVSNRPGSLRIQGNLIGLDATGTTAVSNGVSGIYFEDAIPGASLLLVGGTEPGARNVIFNNRITGIFSNAIGLVVQGNFIGTDITGAVRPPLAVGSANHGDGITVGGGSVLIGGDTAAARNVISCIGRGLRLASGLTTLQGNYIGTTVDGSTPLGNQPAGVRVENDAVALIGGTAPGQGNVIAHSFTGGIEVKNTARATILGNSIFDNGTLDVNSFQGHPGIDLNDNGVTPNDSCDTDSGPNGFQNYPSLTSASASAGAIKFVGSLNSTPATSFRIEFFSNPSCEASGNGEGQTYVGSTAITTDGSCGASINVTLPSTVAVGQFISATATDADGNTSEFGPCVKVTAASPTAADGSVSGQITDTRGNPVGGVVITLSGTQNRLTITDGNGNYYFANVETNGFYTITPTRVNYSFSPASRSFSALGVRTEASFTASVNGDQTNAIDTIEFFVRQQYLDFLGREPDPPGFAGWTATINNCAPGDTNCDRIHVSQLFFQSAEFQDRGYFVYRFYPVAIGRKPDYDEFVPDLANISGFLDATQLEAAKVAFIAGFMARPAFANTYNPITNQQYVDLLLSTAAVTLPPATRQALIDGLNNSTLTRAQVLRQIAESNEVSTRYNHQAYAVMEYFGYLRRDPDGFYLAWIQVLDQSNDPRGMVTGFVNSAEYRQRFGP